MTWDRDNCVRPCQHRPFSASTRKEEIVIYEKWRRGGAQKLKKFRKDLFVFTRKAERERERGSRAMVTIILWLAMMWDDEEGKFHSRKFIYIQWRIVKSIIPSEGEGKKRKKKKRGTWTKKKIKVDVSI